MTKRASSIRTRLTVLVLASVRPATLVMFAVIGYHYQREQAQLARETVATARALTAAVDEQLAGIEGALSALATSTLLRLPDLSSFHTQAGEVRESQGLSAITLIGPDGRQLVNTRFAFGAGLPVQSAMINSLRTGKPAIGDLFVGAASGKRLVGVSVPVLQDKRVVYSLNASIEPQQLRDLLLAQRLPIGRIASILDSSGTIVARTIDHDKYVGLKVRDALAGRIRADNEGTIEIARLDGTPAVTAFSRSAVSGWSVVISVPKSELTAELRRSLLLLLLATALSLAIGLAFASFRAARITRSVHALMERAQTLGRGERPDPAKTLDFREAQLLEGAFEQAAARLAQANAQLERRLEALLESAMDAVLAVDDAHRIVVFNAAAATLFGYPAAQALGMPLAALLPPHGSTDEEHWLADLLRAGDKPLLDALDLHAQRRDGTRFPVEVSVSTVREARAVYHMVFMRDITEKKQAQQALLRSNRDLQQFAFIASHDLRSPLRSIKGYLDLLGVRHGAALDDKARDLIRRATGAVDQLDRLTDGLLSFARNDAAPEPVQVDCNEVAAGCLQLLEAAIAERAASISVAPLPTVQADPSQLAQLWQNLIGNALKYCEGRAPVIALDAQRGTGEWVFSVADNGIGIEPQYREQIFEIFKRLHGDGAYPGSGIGLSICQRIVERHGGRIWVESTPGQGSTFFFTLPDSQPRHS